jgi:hypothetical protein
MGCFVIDANRRRIGWKTLTGVVIVALVVNGLVATLWSQQRRLIYFPTRGPVPSAATMMRGAQDVVLETADGLRLGAWYLPGPGRGPIDAAGRCLLHLASEDADSPRMLLRCTRHHHKRRSPPATLLCHPTYSVLVVTLYSNIFQLWLGRR